MDEVWQELKEKDALVNCKDCGVKIWKFWHIAVDGVIPEMDKCGPCYFTK